MPNGDVSVAVLGFTGRNWTRALAPRIRFWASFSVLASSPCDARLLQYLALIRFFRLKAEPTDKESTSCAQ